MMTTFCSGQYNLPSTMNHRRTQYMMGNKNIYNFKNKINAVTDDFLETKRRVDAIKNELVCHLNGSCPIHILCSCLVDLSDRLVRLIPQISYYYPHDNETLVELLFTAIKKVNHRLYSSIRFGIILQDRDRDSLRMLLIHAISLRPLPFSFPQFMEIEDMISMIPTMSFANTNGIRSYETGVVEAVSDYQKDFGCSWMYANGDRLPTLLCSQETDYTNTHAIRSYETGVVEAPSDYQKDFGCSWMYANGNRLPTPMCPQETNCTRDFDTIDEISSSMNLNPNVSLVVNAPQNTKNPHGSDVLEAVLTRRQKFARSWMYTNKLPSPARSQEADHTKEWDGDIYGNSSSINLLKRKIVAELVLDGPVLKRQRNDTACELFTDNLRNIDHNLKPVNLFQNQTGLICEQVNAGPVQQRKADALLDVEHFLDGYNEQQKADFRKERARRLEEQKKLFANRKLSLVLDLDHTLLNSVKFEDVDPRDAELLRKKEEQERGKPERHLFRLPHMSMWTKLRPGIWKFLEKASMMFELHISTMGNKCYATEMAKLLDPKGKFFSGRVTSRGDDKKQPSEDEIRPKTKDMEGILGMESSVVIIDDTVCVWPHHKLNLINVERYIFFPSSRRQLGLSGVSLLEVDHDERQEDGTLASALALIEKIHESFFANDSVDEADVRHILASEQRKVLAGCRILFSKIIPIGEANPDRHPLWQTAERFGAVCTSQIDDQVTHVVARSLGTDKVNWALSKGRFVVHPGWLEASAFLYRRANEQHFAIKGQK